MTFRYFEAYMLLMLLYWVIILVLERAEALLERKFSAGYVR